MCKLKWKLVQGTLLHAFGSLTLKDTKESKLTLQCRLAVEAQRLS